VLRTYPGILKTIVEFYGVVSGSTVRAKHIGRDIMAGLKNIVGGELKGATPLVGIFAINCPSLSDRRLRSDCDEGWITA